MAHLSFSVQAVVPHGSVGVTKLDMKDVWSAVEQEMGITHDHIDGVQQWSNRRWDITLQPQSQEIYNNIQIGYMEKQFRTATGKLVKITDPLETVTEITVRKVPMYWSQHRVLAIFSKYGIVKHMRKERYRHTDAEGTTFTGLWNGNLRIQMVIKAAIPSGITISGVTLQIFHYGQQPTCRTCGIVGHLFYECKTPRPQRRNVFNLEDFPELPTRQQTPQHDAGETSSQHDEMSSQHSERTASQHDGEASSQHDEEVSSRHGEETSSQHDAASQDEMHPEDGVSHQEEERSGTDAESINQNTPANESGSDSDTESFSSVSGFEHHLQLDTVINEDVTSVPSVTITETPLIDIQEVISEDLHDLANPLEHTSSTPVTSSTLNAIPEQDTSGTLVNKENPARNSKQSNKRKDSQRRPRTSSTTSTEDVSTVSGQGPVHTYYLENDQDEAEPFSQVFINRTKERMLKKKSKRNENTSNEGLWV